MNFVTRANRKQYEPELLVAGFVRGIEAMYTMQNIPNEIISVIYIYEYFSDEWSKKYSSNNIIIDDSSFNEYNHIKHW